MKKKFKTILWSLLGLAVLGLIVLYLISHPIVVLQPMGWVGEQQKNLIYTTIFLLLIVIIPVFFLTVFFVWKYKEGSNRGKYTPLWDHSILGELIWWGIPFIIVGILAVITWKSSHELNPFKPLESDKKPLKIQVIALEWKWLFIYPEQKIATVNFIQIPEQVPIEFEITSDAPMNSFWIPQLGGQIYAMPAMRTKLHLIANEVGTFQGGSAHLSGKGFAGMQFKVEASTQQAFDQWVGSVQKQGNPLDYKVYEQLVQPSEYVPVQFFRLQDLGLFDSVIMKYMTPVK